MSITPIKVRIVKRPIIKARFVPQLPANLTGRTAIAVERNGSIYYLDLDYSKLAESLSFDPAQNVVAILRSDGVWQKTTVATLSTMIGADKPNLVAIANAATSADKLGYWSGPAQYSLTDFTGYMRTLLDDPDATTARATLGLVIGTDVQPHDAELDALAGLVSAADRLPYFTGPGTAALTVLTPFARTLLDDVDAAAMRATIDAQQHDTDLDAIAALAPADDDFIQRKAGAWVNRSVAQVKTDLAINNVDNTSDLNKPISTATQGALDLKADKAITVSAGTGLTGGGDLSANRSVALSSASIASLGKADSALQSVVAGANVTVDNTDPRNPVISATGGSGGDGYATESSASGPGGAETLSVGGVFSTQGKGAPGDGGGGQWIVEGSDPGNTFKLNLNSSGKYARSLERVLRPQQFGAVRGGTDQQQAFIDMASEIRWRATNGGGVRVEFDDYAAYGVFDTAVPAGQALLNIDGTTGVKINFNGSKLVTANPFSSAGVFFIVFGQDVDDLTVHDFFAQQTAYTTLDSGRGINGIYLGGACRNLDITMKQIGGQTAFAVMEDVNGLHSFDYNDPARNIRVMAETDSVFYGINTRFNGHNLEADLYARNVGRAYFPYNVRNHKVRLDVEPGATNECVLIKTYAVGGKPNLYNRTNNIDVDVHCRGTAGAAPRNASLICLSFQQMSSSPSTFAGLENIKLRFDVENTLGSQNLGAIVTTQKRAYDDSPDTTARSYLVSNIDLSGVIRTQNAMSAKIFELFTSGTASVGGWSGDMIDNINIHDVFQYGTGDWDINAAVINNGLSLKGVNASSAELSLGTPNAGVLDASRQVNFSNFKSHVDSSMTAGSSGYRRLPDGRVEMYGVANIPSNANTNVTFPLTITQVEQASLSSMVAGATTGVNVFGTNTTTLTINATSSWAGGNVAWRVIARI